MNHIYAVIVKGLFEEPFTAYTASDLDEAEGHKQFLEATMKGAKVRIERYEWEEER